MSTTAAIAAEPAGTHRVPLGGQALQQRLDSLVHLVVDVLHGSGRIVPGTADHGPAAVLHDLPGGCPAVFQIRLILLMDVGVGAGGGLPPGSSLDAWWTALDVV